PGNAGKRSPVNSRVCEGLLECAVTSAWRPLDLPGSRSCRNQGIVAGFVESVRKLHLNSVFQTHPRLGRERNSRRFGRSAGLVPAARSRVFRRIDNGYGLGHAQSLLLGNDFVDLVQVAGRGIQTEQVRVITDLDPLPGSKSEICVKPQTVNLNNVAR